MSTSKHDKIVWVGISMVSDVPTLAAETTAQYLGFTDPSHLAFTADGKVRINSSNCREGIG